MGPTIRRRRLGADLRRLREQSSLRLDEVANQLGVAPSTLSRIETGKAPTRTSYLALMLDLYEVHDADQRRLLMDLAREGQRKGWWVGCDDLLPAGAGTYLGLEAEATALRVFQALGVPGLVQTEEYARAAIAARRPDLGAEQVRRLAGLQLCRQEVLRRASPVRLRLVLDESVLLRCLGSAGVLRAQLDRLLKVSSQQTVTIQVLAFAAAKGRALAPSFSILSFDEPGDADVAVAEGLRGQVLLEQRPAEVQALRQMFDTLAAAALPAAESAQLIRAHAQSL